MKIKSALLLFAVMLNWPISGPANAATKLKSSDIASLNEVINLIKDHHTSSKTTDELIGASIDGMLRSLDHYSRYFSPEDYEEFKSYVNGKFIGIGIEINKEDIWPYVYNVYEDSPAAKKDLRKGDKIMLVNGKSMQNFTPLEAAKELKGSAGTGVNITVIRDQHATPIEIYIVREEIEIKNIYHKKLPHNIYYYNIKTFNKKTQEQFVETIKQTLFENKSTSFNPSKVNGIIIDLRDNGGGLLDQAVDISNLFLEKDSKIVEVRTATGQLKVGYITNEFSNLFGNIPLIILVNNDSASAAEVVVGALKDNKRALIVGEKTFGKGAVQDIIELNSIKGAAIKLTTSYYYTPSGNMIDKVGIDPHITVNDCRLNEDKAQTLLKESMKSKCSVSSLASNKHQDAILSEAVKIFTTKNKYNELKNGI